jgi:hypothetical protein
MPGVRISPEMMAVHCSLPHYSLELALSSSCARCCGGALPRGCVLRCRQAVPRVAIGMQCLRIVKGV